MDLPETKPLSEEKKLNACTMCCCVCAALTSLAQVPSSATEQRVPWDRLGASHCALAAGISQERNWDAEQQTDPGTWLGVHPAEVWAPPRDTVGEQQLPQAATAPGPCRRGRTREGPGSREVRAQTAPGCQSTRPVVPAQVPPFKGKG